MGPCRRFDNEKTYTPLFFLAEPPNSYLAALDNCAEENVDLLPISSNAPFLAQILSEIDSHTSKPLSTPMPFLNATIPEIYSFVRSHLLEPADARGLHHFTDFTFAAIDSKCFGKSPAEYTILICSDAPDFQEAKSEVRLKTTRVPLSEALTSLLTIETLTKTPKEVQISPPPDSDLDIVIVKTFPPVILMPIEPYTNDEDQKYIASTPAEARVKKREAIMAAEAAGWRIGRGHPGGEPILAPSELGRVKR